MAELIDFLNERLDEDEATARVATRLMYDASFIAPFTPSRILADVQAKRAIVDQAACEHCATDGALQWALRVLSYPYADHPDYDPRWRP
jgi:hypothetical protein